MNPQYPILIGEVQHKIATSDSVSEIQRLKNVEFDLYCNRYWQGDLRLISEGRQCGQYQMQATNTISNQFSEQSRAPAAWPFDIPQSQWDEARINEVRRMQAISNNETCKPD